MAEPTAFQPERLLEHSAWIRRLARRLVRGEGRQEDLVQETWLAALRARPDTSRPLRPWLARVARNFARTWARGDAGRRTETAGDELAREEAAGGPSAAELVERAEVQRELVGAVLALDDPYRSVLLLRYYEGLEPGEIARRRGVPSATVRSQLHRGVERLRARLDERLGDRPGGWWLALAPLVGAAGGGPAGVGSRPRRSGLWSSAQTAVLVLGIASAVLLARYVVERTGAPTGPEPESAALVGAAPPAAQQVAAPVSAGGRAQAAPGDERPAVAAVPAVSGAPERPVLTARLVDEASGLPVPHFRLRVVGAEGAEEELVTDARGRFTTQRGFAPGTLRVIQLDNRHPSDLVQRRRDEAQADPVESAIEHAGAEEVDLAVPTGPTYRFATPLPAGLAPEDFDAVLMCSDPRRAFDKLYASLRPGPEPWVRFGSLARFLTGGPEWCVQLMSRDGFWVGRALVTEIAGVHADVEMEWRPTGRVHGTVRSADGAPVARNWVQLHGEGSSWNDAQNRPILRPTDAEGRYDHRCVPPGKYLFKVEVPGAPAFEEELEVVAGRARVIDVTAGVLLADESASLSGAVTSESGTCRGEVVVFARAGDDPSRSRSARVQWTADGTGRWVGAYRIERLQEGRAVVVAARSDDFLDVTPEAESALPGEDGPALHVLDGAGHAPLTVSAKDCLTGAPLAHWRVFLTRGEARRNRTVPGGTTQFLGLAPADEIDWHVYLAGYQPLWGGTRRVGSMTGAGRGLALELAPGWGAEVTVVDEDGRALAGAHVQFDGRESVRTGADGKVRVGYDARPRSVRVSFPGHELSERGGVFEDGSFRDDPGWLRVVLRPLP